MACADTATDKAKPAIAINLIILYLLKPSDLDFSQQRQSSYRVRAAQTSGGGRPERLRQIKVSATVGRIVTDLTAN